MLRRYERLQYQSAASVYQVAQINSVVQGIGATFSQLAVVIFVSIGALYVVEGNLTVGALAAGSMLASRVLQPGLKGMGVWTQFQSLRLARSKVEDLFSLPKEHSGQHKSEEGLNGQIELRNIHFRYPGQEKELLQGLNLEIRPGEAIGITGHNGAGKSTLISLLSGFIHPDEGKIILDGRDIKDYEQEYLRSQIGIVPQKGTLFEGSILENMTLYREGKAIDQALELSEMLRLDDIIARFPDGLDTQVGGSATDNMSEGVRQKIVMVRSLVGSPSVILFDDASANFDIKNDRRLFDVLKQFKGKHTMVIISHRPGFLRLCDHQFELSDGKLERIKMDRTAQPLTNQPLPHARQA